MTGADALKPSVWLIGLLCLALALGGTVVLEVSEGMPDSGAVSPLRANIAGSVPARPAHPAEGQVSAWTQTALSRPLFSPGRRPAAAVAATPAQAAAGAVLPRMTGTLVTPSARRAIFAGTDGKSVVVAEGGQLGPFTVKAVRAGQAVVSGPDGDRLVVPAFDPDAPPPGASSASAPGGLPGLPGFRLDGSAGLGGVPGLTGPGLPPPQAARPVMCRLPLLWLAIMTAVAGCARDETPVLSSLAPLPGGATQAAPPRISGPVGSTDSLSPAEVSLGRGPAPLAGPPPPGLAGGDISLDFADTDVREVVAQILGTILRVNYTVDPAVRGTVTLHTTSPIARTQLLPTLQAVLAQNGAAVTLSGGLYRVLPAAAAAAAVPAVGTDPLTGGAVVALRFASAEDLARVLQPYVGNGGRVVADPGRNALLVGGEPASREALVSLIRAFDVDALAGQSYALFPVGTGSAKDFAGALADAFRSQAGGSLAGVVRIVPMERIGSVLLISTQPRYIDEARRVFGLVDRARRQSIRTWSVYYLQNGRSNDIAYVLQQAFTPNHVSAQPSSRALGQTAPGRSQRTAAASGSGGGIGQGAGQGLGSGINSGSGASGGIGTTGAAGGLGTQTTLGAQPQDPASNPANPLFGGLDPGAGASGGAGAGNGGGDDANTLRIIPNPQNNALLVYATPQEKDTVEAMLRKIDILPLQVRIDATIAEVSLNDQLQYGTQFFFKAGGINGELSFLVPGAGAAAAAQSFANGFPGFVLSGPNNGNAALNALQSVTNVKVLSSPQVLVLDNEAARLQVGSLVPYLTSSSQSTLTANAPVLNSVNYRETGVILDVTPRVNSGGLVTLDISQEVSDVDTSTVISGINSPVFSERNVSSRVVVQDGQTIGLAGLIRDTASRGNSGIPFLKDIPLLGLLAGNQSNSRGRTELLVLITPHVVHDQRDARALTEDLRDQISNAATVPDELGRLPPSGSADPARPLRRALRLER